MAQLLKFMSAVAFVSSLVLIHYTPTSEASGAAQVFESYVVVITTAKNHVGSVGGASLQIQSEVSGTVLTLDTSGVDIAAGTVSRFNATSLGISGDICFVQLQYTEGSASEWAVESIEVTPLDNGKTYSFKVDSCVKKLTGSLAVDTCKQRQGS